MRSIKPILLLSILASLATYPCKGQTAKPLPDAPKPKTDQRSFWTGVAALAATQTFDAVETQRTLNRGGYERNPLFGRHPSPAKLAFVNAAFFTGQTYLFYRTEHSRKWYWRWAGRVLISYAIVEHARYGACGAAQKRCIGNGLL